MCTYNLGHETWVAGAGVDLEAVCIALQHSVMQSHTQLKPETYTLEMCGTADGDSFLAILATGSPAGLGFLTDDLAKLSH